MAEIWKGLAMFKITIVAWLVILIVALTVVTLVTRIMEKCGPSNRGRKLSEKSPFVTPNSGFSPLKHQLSQPPKR